MKNILEISEKIIPEAIDLLVLRYNLLREIIASEPIGRRGLAKQLDISERTVRTEVEFLLEADLIEVHNTGINITSSGRDIVDSLREIMKDIFKLEDLSKIIEQTLGYKKVFISQGIYDGEVKLNNIGKMAGEYLLSVIEKNSTIALTGGNTIKNMIEEIHPRKSYFEVMVVPARGGMGRNFEIQSNTLAEMLSKKLQGSYRLLNVPDNIGEEARKAMLKEEEVADTISKIRVADIVIAGIGRADVMVKRRGLRQEDIYELEKKGAVGEFFGSYFDSRKKIVKQNKAIGMSLKEVKNKKEVLILSGGKEKAEAILSVDVAGIGAVLFTDESCARRMVEIISQDMKN